MLINKEQCRHLYGLGVTASSLILYLSIAALAAGILKLLTSKRGRVSLGGLNIQWGN